MSKGITFRPIGWVHSPVQEAGKQRWEETVSVIELSPEHSERLEGIEGFSHIIVIFFMDRVSRRERQMKKFHPMDREELPLLGAFATRSQRRPNPIGLTTVKLLHREGHRLWVQGLDALDSTPVLDIKPYNPYHDVTTQARIPTWVEELERSFEQG